MSSRRQQAVFFSAPSDIRRDTAIYISSDGRRALNTSIAQRPKKRKLDPEQLADPLSSWQPGGEFDSFEDNTANGNPLEEDIVQIVADSSAKRKRYINSDLPMATWRPYAGEFLHELIRHEGMRGEPVCSTCGASQVNGDPALYRCKECFGNVLECRECCINRHSQLPLHYIQEWVGYWKKTDLRSLGLSVQLGHSGCHSCPNPSFPIIITVINSNGLHKVSTTFCECPLAMNASKRIQLLRLGWFPATLVDPQTCATFGVLEQFHQLNLNGALNAHDFINTLERLTDASGLSPVPDRYKGFSRIFRQWAFLKETKRAGRAHDCTGPSGTKRGECAVLCWACPHDGINLPSNWRDVDPKYMFLYSLILAMDANFRLKSRLRAIAPDPALCPGSSYLVDEGPYAAHLRNYVAESDISSCIAFAALTQKETRLTTGLRSSGVAACICARHEVVRPCGVGDLQKGERYSNMDYIFLSAIVGVSLATIILSYDISCQYKKNFRTRLDNMPEALRVTPDKTDIAFVLPSWHALAHKSQCQTEHSIAYHPGAGRTDGEGIERSWAEMNTLATSTKEMAPGARYDTLDSHFGFHNWEKNIHLGDVLSRRLLIAIEERERQINNFRDVTSSITSATIAEWKGMLKRWEKDKSSPNPYEIDCTDRITEAQVRLQLRNDELQELFQGTATIHTTSTTAFLVAGLQIEDQQRRIRVDAANPGQRTANQMSHLEEKRIACLAKIKTFRDLQRLYMPGAVCCIQRKEDERNREALPPKVEDIDLWLPSELPIGEQTSGCIQGLPDMERKLREAQCHDALDALRARLHAKAHLIAFRNKNTRGQVQSTRSRTLIGHIGDRAMFFAEKYRHARRALMNLSGSAFDASTFKELLPKDLTLDNEDTADIPAQEALARAGRDTGPRTKKKSNGKKLLSWIWTAGGGPDEATEHSIHQSVRVEWCKARARKLRWSEEVDLLREEMRRVLRFLDWRVRWWLSRPTTWEGLDPLVSAGLAAYAQRQADLHRSFSKAFEAQWSQPSVEAARAITARNSCDAEDVGLGETFLDGDD
ncbi:hypothetical protein BJ138DRAFT_1118936 [Hygrophoropsis aurantiaca]|uniref:Uncharacterized protein n=1 Tax=Hygrophoropsis aurantiaca TaxID=72124 RepID=A0ACB7ZUU1_9AGAM|nr:hypothetical protein BJ138DRAFT_1118936 [Hygrophoropsis aurantiaca]